nr:hypothetical protein [uncultured Sphingomonas sp.]
MSSFYRAAVEAAAERAIPLLGVVDSVDLAQAEAMGFDIDTFEQDVADEIAATTDLYINPTI